LTEQLLPHATRGRLNCHRINEIGPVPINAGNMDTLPLSAVERQLVLAGQRADAGSREAPHSGDDTH
jgi:hypothetical protein